MWEDSYPIPDEFRKDAYSTEERYREMYRRSVEDPETFRTEQATTFIQWAGIHLSRTARTGFPL